MYILNVSQFAFNVISHTLAVTAENSDVYIFVSQIEAINDSKIDHQKHQTNYLVKHVLVQTSQMES